MFEMRSCLLRCCRVAGLQGTGSAAERPTLPRPAPCRGPCASARGVSGAFRPAPSSPLSPGRFGRARTCGEPTRGFGAARPVRRAAAPVYRSSLRKVRQGVLPGTHRPALYPSADPDCPAATVENCAWTVRVRRVSSVATARCAGNGMACMDNATCGHGGEAPPSNRPGAVRGSSVSTATRTGPGAAAPASRAETGGVRGRIGGAGASRKRETGGGRATQADAAGRAVKKRGKAIGCAEFRGAGAGPRMGRLTPDNGCYRASIR